MNRFAHPFICIYMHIDAYASICIKSSVLVAEHSNPREIRPVALADAILACLTERPMTGYELAKTFDSSIGFFWKADHQQIYRELSKLRERGHIQGREVVQSGKPNKLVYTLTTEGKAAFRHWAARPSTPASIKDDLLVRIYALDAVDIEPLRADLMARQEHHRDRYERYERILKKRFPQGTASPADMGKLLGLRIGLQHERIVAEWCEEAIIALSAISAAANVVELDAGTGDRTGSGD
jgi:DNA-binding PadR family transcriptional regulator